MCGILFFRLLQKQSKYLDLWNAIRNTSQSRGPEASHYETHMDKGVYLAFHRLATYGTLDETNMMPLHRPPFVLMCNGDMYNYKDPSFSHYALQTENDCEIILSLAQNALQRPNPMAICEVPTQLRGVFGALLWDSKHNTLYCMRDAFGVRPLFYLRYEDEFEMFTSDIRVLSKIPDTYRNNIECTIVPPGTLQSLNMTPYEPSKRYLFHTWYVLEPSPKRSLDHPITDEILEQYAKLTHNALLDAIQIRVQGGTRPYGCLLSGGLDSSLVASMVARTIPLSVPLYTFSIGMKGATDTKYALAVANHIGSIHTHICPSTQEMIEAIEYVIKEIGSYDTTTVRASVGNYLVCREAKRLNQCVYLFNGDGADEVMGGYLYFHNAPNATAFDTECRRLLTDIHAFDVLRSDRSIAGNGLAPRTPYLDTKFVQTYFQIPASIRFAAHSRCEKYLMRKGCEEKGYLPNEVLWRTKEAMSDGVSSLENSWHTILQKHADSVVPETYPETNYTHNIPKTKEQHLYRRIFESTFGTAAVPTIPYLWMPRFTEGAMDASARTLSVYLNQNNRLEELGP